MHGSNPHSPLIILQLKQEHILMALKTVYKRYFKKVFTMHYTLYVNST